MTMTAPYTSNSGIWAISPLSDQCWLLCHNQDKWC